MVFCQPFMTEVKVWNFVIDSHLDKITLLMCLVLCSFRTITWCPLLCQVCLVLSMLFFLYCLVCVHQQASYFIWTLPQWVVFVREDVLLVLRLLGAFAHVNLIVCSLWILIVTVEIDGVDVTSYKVFLEPEVSPFSLLRMELFLYGNRNFFM